MFILDGKEYQSEKEISARYGYSRSWFRNNRYNGKPPYSYIKLASGRILYIKDETEKWFMDQMEKHRLSQENK